MSDRRPVDDPVDDPQITLPLSEVRYLMSFAADYMQGDLSPHFECVEAMVVAQLTEPTGGDQ